MKPCSLAVVLMLPFALARGADADWRAELSAATPGDFPGLPPLAMDFQFGWSDVVKAGEAHAKLEKKGSMWDAKVSGRSLGLARVLWPMNATHEALVHASSLLPRSVEQSEKYRGRSVETKLRFDSRGVNRWREVSTSKMPTKWKRVNFPAIRDVIGGVMFVRSQPLRDGDRIGLVGFPGDSPYLAIVTVGGRERIRCMDREWPAIRLELEIRKLEVEDKIPTRAVAHGKFRSGSIWVSDDELRLPLRAEVRIFVGFVYGEMTSYELLSGPSSMR